MEQSQSKMEPSNPFFLYMHGTVVMKFPTERHFTYFDDFTEVSDVVLFGFDCFH